LFFEWLLTQTKSFQESIKNNLFLTFYSLRAISYLFLTFQTKYVKFHNLTRHSI